MKLNSNFYILSDIHLGHGKIIEYAYRPENYEEMIVENWNKVVGKKDKVLILGDLSLTNKEKTIDYVGKLKGQKYLILGNHDGHGEGWYRDCGVEIIPPIYKFYKDKYENWYHVLFTHVPVIDLPKGNWINIHGHIHQGLRREFDLTDRHFNVSVEPLNYTPMRLYEVLAKYF